MVRQRTCSIRADLQPSTKRGVDLKLRTGAAEETVLRVDVPNRGP
jgi:hypothetical protein